MSRFMLPPWLEVIRVCAALVAAPPVLVLQRSERRQRLAQNIGNDVDVGLVGDQWWCDERRIAGRLQVETVGEELLLEHLSAPARCAVESEVDRGEHAV